MEQDSIAKKLTALLGAQVEKCYEKGNLKGYAYFKGKEIRNVITDTHGQVLSKDYDIHDIIDGYIYIKEQGSPSLQEVPLGLINPEGNLVLPVNYTLIDKLNNDWFIIRNGYNQWSCINNTGKILKDRMFCEIKKVNNEMILAAEDYNTVHLLRIDGTVIKTFKKHILKMNSSNGTAILVENNRSIEVYNLEGEKLDIINHESFITSNENYFVFADLNGSKHTFYTNNMELIASRECGFSLTKNYLLLQIGNPSGWEQYRCFKC